MKVQQLIWKRLVQTITTDQLPNMEGTSILKCEISDGSTPVEGWFDVSGACIHVRLRGINDVQVVFLS